MFEQPRIRPATPADAEPLAALAERTFRDTFAENYSTDDIEAYVRDSFSLDRVRAELADDANTFLLAFMDGEEQPDGYAKLRIGTMEPRVPGSIRSNSNGSTWISEPLGTGSGPRSCGRTSMQPDWRATERFGSEFGSATHGQSRSMSGGSSRRSGTTSSS